ncbi:type II 3-dehydroquinate dehydratase [Nostocoides sp. F2B08]|uniref:type II 3-dehydroquinate dehydratase n=1 Tax=Nostocoides sp. F2B08 TaxID=2653936 RepID=UPI001262CAFD|nr:type II 3-dehydroquinate dehydratase [Tetrasphaera sp. F2B08]KAB7746386.1 type II 3-dehydroquinate dehydratase [Tetrasphaera sp. F2B08]
MAEHLRPSIVVLNGPNLNLLGEREPHLYGHATLDDVEAMCREAAERGGHDLDFRQTNHEGVMIDWIQEVRHTADGVVINAAGWTHTSVAIRDALSNVEGTIVEVHITDIHAREEFRRQSFISDVADHVVVGHGVRGYVEAVDLVISREGVPRHH